MKLLVNPHWTIWNCSKVPFKNPSNPIQITQGSWFWWLKNTGFPCLLVVGPPDDIPNISGTIKLMFQTTNQTGFPGFFPSNRTRFFSSVADVAAQSRVTAPLGSPDGSPPAWSASARTVGPALSTWKPPPEIDRYIIHVYIIYIYIIYNIYIYSIDIIYVISYYIILYYLILYYIIILYYNIILYYIISYYIILYYILLYYNIILYYIISYYIIF